MTAITNLERLLSGDESVKPTTRIEQIVKGIDIKPLTHFEQIVCGYDIPPMNRLEQIIKGLDVGGYRSREEYFWGEWASGHGEIEYVGSVPFSVIAKGGVVSEWQIWGNAPYQEHTPFPDNPCEVKGVGERTANLFDKNSKYNVNASMAVATGDFPTTIGETRYTYFFKVKPNTSYTIRFLDVPSDRLIVVGYDNIIDPSEYTSRSLIASYHHRISATKGLNEYTFTTETGEIMVGIYYAYEIIPNKIMLNEGSEPLTYEPYGYKTTVIDSGKNLFDSNNLKYGYSFSGVAAAKPICQYIDATSVLSIVMPCKPNTEYTIKRKSATTSRFSLAFSGIYAGAGKDAPLNFVTTPLDTSALEIKAKSTNNDKYMYIYLSNSGNTKDDAIASGIEIYEEYHEPIETTIYHDEPYFTNDYIRKDKDGGVEHREWKVVDAGDLTYGGYSGASGTYIATISDMIKTTNSNERNKHFKCTHYPAETYNQDLRNMTDKHMLQNNGIIFVRNTDFIGSGDVKDKMKGVLIYYELATPTDTEKDLPEILLVNGYNGIDTDTEIKPEKMSITYKATKERAEYDLQLTSDLLNVMKGM